MSDIDVPPGESDGKQECTRAEGLAAVTVLRPEPFDVVIVADNSGSISWSRDALSAGLRDLLSLVHGQDVRFFLLSATQYGESSEQARDRQGGNLVTYSDESTGAAHENPVTEYEQTCTDQDGDEADCSERFVAGNGFNVRGSWAFEMPSPIAAISPDMDESEIEEQQDRIAAEVLALGTLGAQLEQPVCTLSRYITRAPELLPERAVFVVISDEDDVSEPADCLESYAYDAEQVGAFDGRCDQDCDFYEYRMTSRRELQQVTATCTPLDDKGQPRPENARTSSVSSSSKFCIEGKTECEPDDIEIFSTSCAEESNVISDCSVGCGGAATLLSCSLERPDDSADLCTQSFVEGAVSYDNMADYCEATSPEEGPWMDCTAQGFDEDSIPAFAGPEKLTQVVDVPTLREQADEFHERAEEVFGKGGYFVESIVFSREFSCELQSGQSYGTLLGELATSADDVFPICGDYAPALSRIESFAQRLVHNEFTLALASDETVISVSIQARTGELRELSESDYQYEKDAEVLTLKSGLLGPSDLGVEVTIEDSCIEIVR